MSPPFQRIGAPSLTTLARIAPCARQYPWLPDAISSEEIASGPQARPDLGLASVRRASSHSSSVLGSSPAPDCHPMSSTKAACLSGEMFRLTEFHAVLPEFLHELALVLLGLGPESRERLATISEHRRRRAERALPTADPLFAPQSTSQPNRPYPAITQLSPPDPPTLFRFPSGIARRLCLSFQPIATPRNLQIKPGQAFRISPQLQSSRLHSWPPGSLLMYPSRSGVSTNCQPRLVTHPVSLRRSLPPRRCTPPCNPRSLRQKVRVLIH